MTFDEILTVFLGIVIVVVGLGLGAGTTFADFQSAWKQPQAVLCGFACQYGFMPLFAFTMVKIANLSEYTAIGVILTGASPGGATSNLFCLWSGGDVPLSITMSFCSTMAAMFMLPLLTLVYIQTLSDAQVKIPFLNILLSTLLIVVPTVLGLYMRRVNVTKKAFGRFLWEWLQASTSILGGIFVAAALVASLIMYWKEFVAARWELWIIAFAMEPLGVVFGYYASKLCKLPARSHPTIGIECGMQNFPFTMVIIGLSFRAGSKEAEEALLFPLMYGLAWCINSPLIVLVFRYLCPVPDNEMGEEKESGEKKKSSIHAGQGELGTSDGL